LKFSENNKSCQNIDLTDKQNYKSCDNFKPEIRLNNIKDNTLRVHCKGQLSVPFMEVCCLYSTSHKTHTGRGPSYRV